MNKNVKKILLVLVVFFIIFAIIWMAYELIKPEPASINPVNELPNENMGLDNVINDVLDEEKHNIINENEVVEEDNNSDNVVEEETNKESNSNDNDSEIVSGSSTNRKEKAVELAKKYYEKEYGSTDGIYFEYDSIHSDGRYIVRAGTADTKTVWLLVDINTEIVTEK